MNKQQATSNKQQATRNFKRFSEKLIFLILLLLSMKSVCQESIISADPFLTPQGYFDKVFDKEGVQFKLSEILAGQTYIDKLGSITTNSVLCTSGIFELYFQTGCGMDIVGNPLNDQRRAIVCQAFQDYSDFLNTPLKNSGNTTKIKIWIRSPTSFSPPLPSNVAGAASGFYNLPIMSSALNSQQNAFPGNSGGIVDNEIWKTIHTGTNSYLNTAFPIINNVSSSNFYHGYICINFSSSTIWNYNYNKYNIATGLSSIQSDLYNTILHEITHMFGFESLINQDGYSKLGIFAGPFGYYTRYDKFLKTASGQNLIKNTPTLGGQMFGFGFDYTIPYSVLRPSCTLPNNIFNGNSGLFNCPTAIRYSGTSNVPVYNPPCFEPGSSFSHFEDACYNGNANDQFFLMTDRLGVSIAKRFLSPEERNTMCDIGYSLKGVFGNSGNFTFKNYNSLDCTGITVAGVNDGLSATGSYTFQGNSGTNIVISGILNNDYTAGTLANLRYEYVQDIYDPNALISITTGSSGSNFNLNSNVPGLHLLRYVPFDIVSGQRGNITYIFVNVLNNCTQENFCNLIRNGNFEEHVLPPSDSSQIYKSCGWQNSSYLTSAEYFNSDSTNSFYSVPCNIFGYQDDKIIGNHGYAGMFISPNRLGFLENTYSEPLKTEIISSLLPNTNYQLSFDVSLSETLSQRSIKFQAFFTDQVIDYISEGIIPDSNITANTIFLTNNNFSTAASALANGWETITFNFNTGSKTNLKYLHIGGLKNVQFQIQTNLNIPSSCVVAFPNPNIEAYYYLDNVSLSAISNNNGTFTLPPTIACSPQLLPNLSLYLANLPAPSATNTFSLANQPAGSIATANTVQNVSGQWQFNTAGLISGNYTIRYTYTNAVGCVKTIDSNITILPCDVLVANTMSNEGRNLGCKFLGSTQPAEIFPNCTINGLVATYPRAFATQTNAIIPGVTISPDGYLAIGSNVLPGYYVIDYKICQTSQPLNCSNTARLIFNITPRIQANDDDVFVDPFGNVNGSSLSGFSATKNDFMQCNLLNLVDVTLSVVTASPAFSLNLTTGQITLANNNPIGVTFSMIYRIRLNSNPAYFSDATIYVRIEPTMGLGANSRVLTTDLISGSNAILVTGDFTTFTGYNRKNIALLNNANLNQIAFQYNTANLGPTHATLTTNLIQKVCVDGASTFLGGQFTGYTGSVSNRIVKIATSNGIKDMSFGASMNNTVYDIKKIPGVAQILVAGSFSNTYGSGVKQGIARLSSVTGALDTSFNNPGAGTPNAGANGIIDCMAIQADGKIIITGNFTFYNGTATGNGIARLNANGTLDTTFNIGGAGFNSVIVAGATEANFKKILIDSTPQKNIFICGKFDTYNGSQARNIVKIKSDGLIDANFVGRASSKVNDMVLDPLATSGNPANSLMYIGGQFNSYYSSTDPTIFGRRLAKISTSSGELNINYTSNVVGSGFDNIVHSTTLQPDNRLIVSGAFTTYKGFQAKGITRINAAGYQGKLSNENKNEPINSDEILIYPNPSDGKFYLDLKNIEEKFDEILIFNILGQQIISTNVNNHILNEINLQEYSQGIYLLKLKNNSREIDFKIIKN